MPKELFFSLEKTYYSDNSCVLLSSICMVHGVSSQPLCSVSFDISGPAITITALDVIAKLASLYPEYTIINAGPTESTVILKHTAQSKAAKYAKALLLCVVMFFGGAIAIMTFHEDVNMPAVHRNIYAFFTGEMPATAPVVSIPYSVGIAVGFVLLFGLYRRHKGAPTVLDIDIHNHENSLRDYLAARSKRPDG